MENLKISLPGFYLKKLEREKQVKSKVSIRKEKTEVVAEELGSSMVSSFRCFTLQCF
jgi:hypothetical protein